MSYQFQAIRTFARIKPLFNTQEKVFFRKNSATVLTKNNDEFMFGTIQIIPDQVFDEECSNRQIYDLTTKHILQQSFNGFNGCVMAYGQTCSGKTHTMKGTQQSPGIVPLTLYDIFRKINEQKHAAKVIASYMEIYNQQIIDLLAEQDNQFVDIKQDQKKILVFTNLKEFEIRNFDDAIQLFKKGEQKRKFASNNLNVNSSRSHAIFRISLKICDNDLNEINSQINLVDLAGSEGIQKTKGQKNSKIEGENINKSLLALTKIFKTMSERSQPHQFIGFRESKLTRILEKSLCENAKSSIICMITPTISNYQESMNTLRFGQMASKIKVEAKQNIHRTQERRPFHLRNMQFLPTERIELEQARQKLMQNQEEILILNEKLKQLQEENITKDLKISLDERKLNDIIYQLNNQKLLNQKNRQDWWRQKQLLQNRVANYQEEVENLEKINGALRAENRVLQKNEKGLVQTLQHYQNQCRNLNSELTSIKQKLDQENSKMAKPSSVRQMMKPQKKPNITDFKPNPFKLQPYQEDPNRLSPSKLSWIVRLKVQVIDLNRKVNEYIKANIEIAEENDELKRRIDEYQEKISKQRSSGKINPEALEYNEIKKLNGKIKKLQAELKRCQQKQKKHRQVIKKQTNKNLIDMEEFQEWYSKKYLTGFFTDQQVQTESLFFAKPTLAEESSEINGSNNNQPQKMQMQSKLTILPHHLSPCKSQHARSLILNKNTILTNQNPQDFKFLDSNRQISEFNQEKPIPNQNLDLNITKSPHPHQFQNQDRQSNHTSLLEGLSPCSNFFENTNKNFLSTDQTSKSKRAIKSILNQKPSIQSSKKLKTDQHILHIQSYHGKDTEKQKDIEI